MTSASHFQPRTLGMLDEIPGEDLSSLVAEEILSRTKARRELYFTKQAEAAARKAAKPVKEKKPKTPKAPKKPKAMPAQLAAQLGKMLSTDPTALANLLKGLKK